MATPGRIISTVNGMTGIGPRDIVRLDSDGALPAVDGSNLTGISTSATDTPTPLTTKGDLLVHTGSDYARQGVGTNGYIVVADSTQDNGLKWTAPTLSPAHVEKIQTLTTVTSTGIPFDNTTPQITEGTQVFSFTYTMIDPSRDLFVEVLCHNTANFGAGYILALFDGSGTGAFGMGMYQPPTSGTVNQMWAQGRTSGQSGAITISGRMGCSSGSKSIGNDGFSFVERPDLLIKVYEMEAAA